MLLAFILSWKLRKFLVSICIIAKMLSNKLATYFNNQECTVQKVKNENFFIVAQFNDWKSNYLSQMMSSISKESHRGSLKMAFNDSLQNQSHFEMQLYNDIWHTNLLERSKFAETDSVILARVLNTGCICFY